MCPGCAPRLAAIIRIRRRTTTNLPESNDPANSRKGVGGPRACEQASWTESQAGNSMEANRNERRVRSMLRYKHVTQAFAAGFILAISVFWPRRPFAAGNKIFAQRLVEQTLSKHPEITGLEMSANGDQGCKSIASTETQD